jgi:hypothetical protein
MECLPTIYTRWRTRLFLTCLTLRVARPYSLSSSVMEIARLFIKLITIHDSVHRTPKMRPPFETGASYALCNLLTPLVFRNGNLLASHSLTHSLSATYRGASLEWDMHLGTPIGNARLSAGWSNVSWLHLKRAS